MARNTINTVPLEFYFFIQVRTVLLHLISCPLLSMDRVLKKSLHLSWSFHVSSSIISIHLIPLFSTFFFTCSSHLYFDWPLGFFPPKSVFQWLSLYPCSIHPSNVAIPSYFTIFYSSCILSNFKISLNLFNFLYPFSLVFPNMLLKNFHLCSLNSTWIFPCYCSCFSSKN